MGKDQSQNSGRPSPENGVLNPFPGLRPFSSNESHLFFGRKGQSEQVMSSLLQNRFVALMGASGSGKSSLIFCGLTPMLHARSSWQVVSLRPGNSPVANLAEALAACLATKNKDEIKKGLHGISETLQQDSRGLVETVKDLRGGEDKNFLILVDQFEELFRYHKSSGDQTAFSESASFVKLLIEAVRQFDEPVYVVLTMRSDFIGDCAQFHDLTELINSSNYLLPQMTENDYREAITGPVEVGGAGIDADLVRKLLDDVGDKPGQLPVLQHAMMRTWDYWTRFRDPGRPVGISDYEAVGTMERALSEHANEVFDELSQEGKSVCESVFKTLTEKGSGKHGIRHPARVDHLAAIARVKPEDIMELADRFRTPGRSFLVPSDAVPLTPDSIVDLSHESIIRVWDRLSVWVEEEAQAVNMYQRLAEAAGMFQEGETGLWRPPDLQLALNWRRKQQPTLTWAERYDPAFERAMVYLDASEKEHLAEEENKIRMQRRALKRTRITAMVLGIAAILSLAFMLFAVQQRVEADKQRELAEERRIEADDQRKLAVENAEEATRQKGIAIAQADTARLRRLEADSAKLVAQANEKEATRQKGFAETSAEEARLQEKIAIEQKDTATIQRIAAEEARDETYRLRLQSIAQSMSVKSLQIDDDPDLKGLLAYQAYKFHNEYGGAWHNRDIYAGLYDASKTLKGEDQFLLPGHDNEVTSIAVVPGQSRFFTAGKDGKVLEWDSEGQLKQPKTLIDNTPINNALSVSSNGQWLACGTDGLGVQVWNIQKSITRPQVYKTGDGKIKSLAFLADNKLLVSGRDNAMFEVDLESGNVNQIFTAESVIRSLAASPDGQLIAGGTLNGKILVWSVGDWNNPFVLFEEQGNAVDALVFSNSGVYLSSGDEQHNIRIWNIKSRTLLENLRGPQGRIYDLAFSPDDQFFASASHDNRVQIWLTEDWNIQPIVINVNDVDIPPVYAVAFSKSGGHLITGAAGNNRLTIRPTTAEAFVGDICSSLKRNMTQAEWKIYVAEDIAYVRTCPDLSTAGK